MFNWQIIMEEACKGNYSFFILVVGILAFFVCTAQLIVMITKKR